MKSPVAIVAPILLVVAASLACGGPAISQASSPGNTPTEAVPGPPVGANDENVAPPGDGLYVVVDGRAVALANRTNDILGNGYSILSDSDMASLVSTKPNPLILFQSQSASPGDIHLSAWYASGGFHCMGKDGIYSYDFGGGASGIHGGLEQGDIVTSIDGKQTDSCSWQDLNYRLGDTAVFTVLRGTQTLHFKILINAIVRDLNGDVPLSIVPKGKYVQLEPEHPLTGRFYCLYYPAGDTFCFVIGGIAPHAIASPVPPTVSVTPTLPFGHTTDSSPLKFTDRNHYYAIDVPGNWLYTSGSGDGYYSDRFSSPDQTSFVENLTYTSASSYGLEPGQFARQLLDRFYASASRPGDIQVTEEKPQSDGSTRLRWNSSSGGYSGISFYEGRSNDAFLMLTLSSQDTAPAEDVNALNAIVDSYRLP